MSLRQKRLIVGSTVAAVLVGIAVLVASASGKQSHQFRYVTPKIRNGITPRQSPTAIEKKVFERLGPDGRIDSATLVPTMADVPAIERNSAIPEAEALKKQGYIWIVRAHGKFTATRGRQAQKAESPTGTGYYLLDDDTGQIVGMGWP
jgi:hypothetical protein